MLKIALCDLNHKTIGTHSETAPYPIGLIAAYALHKFPEQVECKIFKFTDDYEEALQNWTPDVFALSLYSWNTNLGLNYAEHTKKLNPNVKIIAGGPNVPLLEKDIHDFYAEFPFVDFLVQKDGEVPFSLIIEKFLAKEDLTKYIAEPLPSTIMYDHPAKKIYQAPIAPRMKSLDEAPSPYLMGLMDKFIYEYQMVPSLETNRGCPFTCTFCHQSVKYYSRLLWADIDRLRKEFTMFAQAYTGRHETPLNFCDSNFGTFPRDQEIAKIVREIQDEYDWPRHIRTTTGKTKYDNIQKASDILKYGLTTIASVQTMTPEVLQEINRKNLKFEEFMDLQENAKKAGGNSLSEIILSLPKETKASFYESLDTLMRAKIDIIIPYTLMNLRGTPMYDYHRKHEDEHVIKYRVVPRQFGEYNGSKVFDYEEVVVGTPTLPYEDYVECRGISYLLRLLYNPTAYSEFMKILREYDVNIFDWVLETYNTLLAADSVPGKHLRAFLQETRDELWDTPEQLMQYFSEPDNYQKLLDGRLGGNLLSKYQQLAVSEGFEEWLEAIGASAMKRIQAEANEISEDELNTVFSDIKSFIRETRNVMPLFDLDKIEERMRMRRNLQTSYDILGWTTQKTPMEITKFKKPTKYAISYTDRQKKLVENIFSKGKATANVRLQRLLIGRANEFWAKTQKVEQAN